MMNGKRFGMIALALFLVLGLGSAVFAADPNNGVSGVRQEGDHSKNSYDPGNDVKENNNETNKNIEDNNFNSDSDLNSSVNGGASGELNPEDDYLTGNLNNNNTNNNNNNVGNNKNRPSNNVNQSTSNNTSKSTTNSGNGTTTNGSGNNSNTNNNSNNGGNNTGNGNNMTTNPGNNGNNTNTGNGNEGDKNTTGSGNSNENNWNLENEIAKLEELLKDDNSELNKDLIGILEKLVESLKNEDLTKEELAKIEEIINKIQEKIDNGEYSNDIDLEKVEKLVNTIKDIIKDKEQEFIKKDLKDILDELKDNGLDQKLVDDLNKYIDLIGTDKTIEEALKIAELKEDIINQIEDLKKQDPTLAEELEKLLHILNGDSTPSIVANAKGRTTPLSNYAFTGNDVTLKVSGVRFRKMVINNKELLIDSNKLYDSFDYSNDNEIDNYSFEISKENNYQVFVIDNHYNKVEVEFTIVKDKPFVNVITPTISENKVSIAIITSEKINIPASAKSVPWKMVASSSYYKASDYVIDNSNGPVVLDTITLQSKSTLNKATYNIILEGQKVYFRLVN